MSERNRAKKDEAAALRRDEMIQGLERELNSARKDGRRCHKQAAELKSLNKGLRGSLEAVRVNRDSLLVGNEEMYESLCEQETAVRDGIGTIKVLQGDVRRAYWLAAAGWFGFLIMVGLVVL
jgi:hypothetical protein